jgi:hypothetical protein
VPEAISAISMKLLEKQPEGRYPGAAVLCSTVEAALVSADAAWTVPLCDAHAPDNVTTVGNLAREDGDDGVDHWLREARHKYERPRRGRRPVPAAPEGKPLLPSAVAVPPTPPAPPVQPPAVASLDEHPAVELELKGGPLGPVSSSKGGHRIRAGALSIPLLGTAALVLVLGLAVAALQLHPRPATSPPTTAAATEEPRARLFEAVPEIPGRPTWEVGWKVASLRKSPESAQVAASLDAEPTPAAVASRATPSKDMPSVKNPQQKPQKQLQGLGPVRKMIGAGAACIAMACTGPQVRPEPPAEPCPSGAVEAMAELGIGIGDDIEAVFLSGPITEVIPVREGWTHVQLSGRFKGLPPGVILKGRLIFGGERVYGRFTEAQDTEGSRTWPICMELLDTSEKRGLELKPGSTAEAAKVFNSVVVDAVDRFK